MCCQLDYVFLNERLVANFLSFMQAMVSSQCTLFPSNIYLLQDPILQNFAQLKNALFKCEELSTLDPNVFLSPFLEVIRSEDTSGPITGIALTSLSKFLSYGLVGTTCSESAAAAVENIAGECCGPLSICHADEVAKKRRSWSR